MTASEKLKKMKDRLKNYKMPLEGMEFCKKQIEFWKEMENTLGTLLELQNIVEEK